MKILFTENTAFPVQNAQLAHELYFTLESRKDGVMCTLQNPEPPRPILATVRNLFSSFVFYREWAKYETSIPKKA